LLKTLNCLPEHILIADSDCWKFQIVLVFHADVNVLRMRQEIRHFSGNEVCEETGKTENYH